jgi:hypothetical protein
LWIPEPTPPEELGVSRSAAGSDGALLRYTALSEVYDQAARTRTTTTRYERHTPSGGEQIEREWLLHWHTQEQFRAMCAQAGLSITSMTDDEGKPADPAATDFTATVRRN